MRRLRAWLLRLAGLAHVGRRDPEITEELQAHRAFLAAEYERTGLTPAEARRRAGADFGSLTAAADAYRDRRSVAFLEHWVRDSAYALRSLARSPGLVASMVLVLGLGIGLSTAIATVFHGVVWQGLPVPEPDRVVKLSLDFQGKVSRHVSSGEQGFSYPELTAYRQATRALAGVAGVEVESVTWQSDVEKRSLAAALVTADYFRALSVTAIRGRLLTADDERQPVAVVSYRFWQESLGGRADVLGSAVVLDRASYSVIGVTAEPFTGTDIQPVDLWVPLEAASTLRGRANALTEQNYSWLEVVGRLAPDASTQTATAESSVIAAQFDRDNPGRRTTVRVERASRLQAGLWASRDRSILIGAGTAAGVLIGVLLFICGSNVAGLLLARGASRQKEMAVRVALGASRGRLTQQLTAEILVIALGSAVVGVLLCTWAFHLVAAWIPLRELLGTLSPDGRVFSVALACALGVAFVFGLAPARQAARVDCLAALNGAGRPGVQGPMMRLRRGLIAMQVAVSLILLVVAALLSRSVGRAFQLDPGYAVAGLYVAKFDAASLQGAGSIGRSAALVRDVRDALANQPGMLAVGLTGIAPFQGSGVSSARPDTMRDHVQVHFNNADEPYFRALGLTPVAGRFARATDVDGVMVNTSLARVFWGSEPAALDRVLEIAGDKGFHPVRVVGVLPTVQTVDIGVPDAPTYYVPSVETEEPRILLIRAAAGISVPRVVADTTRALDRDALVTVQSIDERLALVTGPSRVGAAIAGLIGFLALFIAAVGIHGVVAHAVVARTREIGIRLALGAPRAAVLRAVVGSSVASALVGALAAFAVITLFAVSLSAPVRSVLFGLNPLDPTACAEAVACLASIVLVAAYLPARRALGIAPLVALHHDG